MESNGFYHWLPPHGNKIRLEAYTEQSESNPGRSLGIKNKKKAAVWKTVPPRAKYPRQSDKSVFDKKTLW